MPPQDRQLVAQNEELQFLRAATAREQQDKREQPASNEVDERHTHSQPPKIRNADPPRPPPRPCGCRILGSGRAPLVGWSPKDG
jgi:hypothetical protein